MDHLLTDYFISLNVLACNNNAGGFCWLGINTQAASRDGEKQSHAWHNILPVQGYCDWNCKMYW